MKYIKHILSWLLIIFPLTLLGMVVLAIVLPFIPRDRETLPRCIRWWDNHEAHLKEMADDGLSGPPDYRAALLAKGTDPEGFLARYNWLALRNGLNYFQYKVMGFQVQDDFKVISIKGNPEVGDHKGKAAGVYEVTIQNGGKTYWELYWIYEYPGTDYIMRFRMGWKIGNPYERKPGEWRQWCLSPTPVKKRI